MFVVGFSFCVYFNYSHSLSVGARDFNEHLERVTVVLYISTFIFE